jgi:hypothetical protein
MRGSGATLLFRFRRSTVTATAVLGLDYLRVRSFSLNLYSETGHWQSPTPLYVPSFGPGGRVTFSNPHSSEFSAGRPNDDLPIGGFFAPGPLGLWGPDWPGICRTGSCIERFCICIPVVKSLRNAALTVTNSVSHVDALTATLGSSVEPILRKLT